MPATRSQMRAEIDEIPAAVERLLRTSSAELEAAGHSLRKRDPSMIVTIARGSSDHAAAYLKYAIELVAGIPVASIGPSIMSIYGRELTLKGAAAISISQSGKSPDIVAMTEAARRSGALTLALTNTPSSPLAAAAELSLDLAAGVEKSVAATKSFVNSIVAGLAVLAHWRNDGPLIAALDRLPGLAGTGHRARLVRHSHGVIRTRIAVRPRARPDPRPSGRGRAQIQGNLRHPR